MVRLFRLGGVLTVGGLVAGCFQPLYGTRTSSGTPAIRTALKSVDVEQIDAANGTPEARLAVVIRNSLLFDLTGGEGSLAPTHRLKIVLKTKRAAIIVDTVTARSQVESYGIDVRYALIDVGTGKTVVTGTTFSRVSYDIPGEQQRFARARAMRDAETRAAAQIASNIHSRLASFFVAGA
jgi:LPS-assembly lipoprotein